MHGLMITFLLVFQGFMFLIFWLMFYGLAKDRARRGAGYLKSVVTSLALILSFVILFAVLLSFLFTGGLSLLSGSAHGGFSLNPSLVDFICQPWFVLGMVGSVCCAILGAHFGVIQYHASDNSR